MSYEISPPLTDEELPDKITTILSELYKTQILLEEQIANLIADNMLLEERLESLEETIQHT